MTASIVSSSYITNPRATPPVLNALGASGDASVRPIMGTMEVATTSLDEVGDVILIAEVQGNERIVSIKLFSDDLDSNGAPTLAVDVGLYKNVTNAGTSATVVDADAYASAITDLSSAVKNLEVMCEARDISKIGQTVAADGSESAHSSPRQIGLTVTAVSATPAAGTLSWVILVAAA